VLSCAVLSRLCEPHVGTQEEQCCKAAASPVRGRVYMSVRPLVTRSIACMHVRVCPV
jgi:hypothetical protein